MDATTRKLVDYALGLRSDDIPEDAVHALKRCIIDSVACAMGAADEGPVRRLRSLATRKATDDGASVWGSEARAPAELAGLVNGTMIRFLDFNDHYVAAHPSDLMAAVLASAERENSRPRDALVAIAVTYEVHCALARLPWRAKGWDQGVFGVVATVCGIGRLRELSTGQLADAISIAILNHVSLRHNRAGGLSMWKGIAVPYAAQAAMQIVDLVAEGITGPQRPFDGDDGVFQQLMGPFEIPPMGGAEVPFRLLDVDLKYWPVEFNAQLAVWAGRQIREEIELGDITRIEVSTYHLGWDEIGREPEKWDPRTRETADHSLPYILAIALQKGQVMISDFQPEEYLQAHHRSLMAKISVSPADDITAAYPEQMIMRLRVERARGADLNLELSEPRGRAANPMTDAEVASKYRNLVPDILADEDAEALLAWLWRFEEREELSEAMRLLRRPWVAGSLGARGDPLRGA